MPKQLYEEALADVKKVKQVAEDNAKRAVIEAVTPRIREFIDQALLNERFDDGVAPPEPGGAEPEGELLTDLVATDPNVAVPVDVAGPAAAISPPDADGKVTLDIDALCSDTHGSPVPAPMFGKLPTEVNDPQVEYEVSLESIESQATLDSSIAKMVESVSLYKSASSTVRATTSFRQQIAQMISRVEDMYDHVQEQIVDPAKKSSYETMLEASYKDLNKLQESMTMSKKTNKAQMNEADVTLKLTNLPDDIDLDTVGVDLITGEDEEGGEDEMSFDDEPEMDDLGGDQGGQGDQDMPGDQLEGHELSDDTIVEVDEKMLRREIARIQKLREEKTGPETRAQSWGNGPDHFDSFGGGKDEGEPTEADMPDKSSAPAALPLGEADEDLDEVQAEMDAAEMDESDMMEMELGEAIDGSSHGGNDSLPSNKQSRHPGESFEVAKKEGLRRLGFEKRLQERAKARAALLKKAASKSSGKRLSEIKKEYATVAKRFNESLARAQKASQQVAYATKKLQESRLNSEVTRSAGDSVNSLRKKLAETNLFNAKLLFTNKLLQNESLTARQKAQVIKQLDSAKTVREAKLVYESLADTLSSSKTVNESKDRAVLGSGSRATRTASAQTLTESYEAERWAQLAGITKR